MSFAIYFPGKTGANLDHFRAAGLAELLDDDKPEFVDLQPGPDGGHGVAAHWLKRPIIAGEFDWTRGRKGLCYFGRGAEFQGPRELAREDKHLGEDLVMADGRQWHIPIARQLPQLLGIDDEGRLTKRLLPQYKRFWEEAEKTGRWFEADEHGHWHLDLREALDFCSLALSINYRVNVDVASWLGLVRHDLAWKVAAIVTEGDALRNAQKKTGSAGSPTSAGERG